MKKILTIAAALFMMGSVAKAQIISLDAGYLFSTLTEYDDNTKTLNETSNGAFVGASYNFLITEELGVAPGLYYSFLTNKSTDTSPLGDYISTSKFSEHALNLPVYLNYCLELGHADLYFYAGPTFQYGLSSKYKSEDTYAKTGQKIQGSIDNYQDIGMSRFNLFIGGGIGTILNERIRVTLGYDHGLLNLYNVEGSSLRDYRYNVKLSLAYLFDYR